MDYYGDLRPLDGSISGSLSDPDQSLSGSLTVPSAAPAVDPYTGDYVVIPTFRDQVLETKNKTMEDDVTVKEIPVAEVSNPAGGLTLTIG